MKKLAILTIAIVLLTLATPAQAGPAVRCRVREHRSIVVVATSRAAREMQVTVTASSGPDTETVRGERVRNVYRGKASFPLLPGSRLTDCSI
jgi:hypothetical protein